MDESTKPLMKVSASPHIRHKHTTTSIMGDVLIALIPATIMSIYNFGLKAYILIMVCMVSCMAFEALFEWACKKPITVKDLSAALTGLLLALNLPVDLPVWMAILGSAFAIIVVKQLFGGIGQNFMNPALGGRCFLMMSFLSSMTRFSYDGVTTATPLAILKAGGEVNLMSMFIGNEPGTLGETSVIALLIGAAYLLIKRIISIKIPGLYILSFALCVFIHALTAGGMNLCDSTYFMVAELCGGGLMLGAFFMATDYATSPITSTGKIIYGVLLGVLTFVLRIYGGSAEGVSYAIIISNLMVPLIENATKRKPFGYGYEEKPLSENLGWIGGREDDEAEDNEVSEEEKAKKAELEKAAKKESTPMVILAICIIGLVAGLALGGVYEITKKPIADTLEKNKQDSYKKVFSTAESFVNADDIDIDAANEKAKELGQSGADIDEICYAKDGSGELLGYVVVVTGHEGYSGDIQMVLGIDNNGAITGLSMLTINETTGLGLEARDNPEFAEQYKGKDVDNIKVTKQETAASDEIVAISGATITSNAVTKAVNTALCYIHYVIGGAE